MILMAIAYAYFVVYTYHLFEWGDMLPLTMHDLWYVPLFSAEHMFITLTGFVPNVSLILFEDYSYRLVISGCFDTLCAMQ